MKKFFAVITLLICVMLVSSVSAFAAMSDEDFLNLCSTGTAKEVETAIKNGANVHAVNEAFGFTTLMCAAWENPNPEVISILIKNGVDVNETDDEFRTALMGAASSNPNPEVVSALLQNGADVQAEDFDGGRAIDYASKNAKLKNTSAYQELLAASNAGSTQSGFEFVEYQDKDFGVKYAIVKGCYERRDRYGNRFIDWESDDGISWLQYFITSQPRREQKRLNEAIYMITDPEFHNGKRGTLTTKISSPNRTMCISEFEDGTMAFVNAQIFAGCELNLFGKYKKAESEIYSEVWTVFQNSILYFEQ